jgi:hypothetical protein
VPIESVAASKKLVDVERYYSRERLRPTYDTFGGHPVFLITGD